MNIPGIILVGILAIAAVAIAAVVFYEVKMDSRSRRLATLDADASIEYERWRAQIKRLGGLPSIEGAVKLPEGEKCYFVARAKLSEPRSVTSSRHVGGSIYIAAGIKIFDGSSVSESHDEWRTVSVGLLCVTGKRIIFAGDTQTRTADLADVISIAAGHRGISIGTTSNKKVMFFSGVNGQIARDTIIAMR